ncbi:MAG: ferric reductase-like transmembrane domain-containing protein [Rhizobiaceae bacterium]
MVGQIAVYTLLGAALLLSVPAASHTGLSTWGSLAASSMAFVAMALNQFLATRQKWMEGFFGGLDRMYRTHKNLGKIALALILVHYFVTPNFKGQILTGGLNSLAKDAATIGFWSLIVLIGLSLFKKIPFTKIELPYHLWRQSHRFIGVAFLFLAFHQMFIKRPFDATASLALYLNAFAILGVVSFLYTQLAPFARRKLYKIISADRQGDVTLLKAEPARGSVSSKAGQFAVINFKRSGLKEPHPFTISGRQENGELSFAIKASGDFTRRLHETVESGDIAQIEGGYGRFDFDKKSENQIWLAGGIGITPFLAMAEELGNELASNICLVHCVRDSSEAVGSAQLSATANQVANFSYVMFASSEEGRMDAEKLQERVGFDLDGAAMMFCGPPPLRSAIIGGLKAMNKKLASVKYELFEFR